MASNTQQGDKHSTASAFIITDEAKPRILLVYHKKFGNWTEPGGHIERDENPIQTLIREVLEESGIDLSDYFPRAAVDSDGASELRAPDFMLQELIFARGDEPEHYHNDLCYVVCIPHVDPTPVAGESEKIGWFTLEQLEGLDMFDNVRRLSKKALALKTAKRIAP